MSGDSKKKLNKRIASTMQTLKRLDLYWRHSNCPMRKKLITADAVIRSKLLYGLDSLQLNEPQLKRLDIFQLKILRKILKLKTTYIDRNNTNEKVFEIANRRLQEEKTDASIKPFRAAYRASKLKRLARTIQKDGDDIQNITFKNIDTLEAREPPNRKRCRPKHKWTKKALEETWEDIQAKQAEYREIPYDPENETIYTTIKQHIQDNMD